MEWKEGVKKKAKAPESMGAIKLLVNVENREHL